MRTFDLVDYKVFEADFFLNKLENVGPALFDAQCYFSAFIAAARSITFALQAVMADADNFQNWYATKQDELKKNQLARFFQQVRTESQHIGTNPIVSLTFSEEEGARYGFFDMLGQSQFDNAPDLDAVVACKDYLKVLVELIFECYVKFGPMIDPEQYYTVDNLNKLGLTVEDVEEALGFPRGWSAIDSFDSATRLEMLHRHIPGTLIDIVFHKYLGKGRFYDDPEH